MTALQQFPIQNSFPDAFLSDAPFPAWLKSPDGLYLSANAAADAIMGRRVAGQTVDALFGDGAAETRRYGEAALRNGIDIQVQTVGGQVLTVTRWRIEVHGRALIGGIAIPASLSQTA